MYGRISITIVKNVIVIKTYCRSHVNFARCGRLHIEGMSNYDCNININYNN